MSNENRGMWENTEKGYTLGTLTTFPAVKQRSRPFDSLQINYKLAWECHQSLVIQAKHNRIQLVWVPGHMEIDRNEQPTNQPKKAPQTHSQNSDYTWNICQGSD
jgi:hypothetical protein